MSAEALEVGPWSDPKLARVAEEVRSRAGLVFPENRVPSAESAMRRAMATLGVADADRYVRIVREGGPALDDLLAELTIGETYFFRELPQFDYLRREVLPAFAASWSADRPLRAWSAGCASGEEAHTLAIILREEGWGERSSVLGTDVSRRRLLAARHGEYTKWSLRGVAPEVVDRYFSRRGMRFVLDPAIRGMATFRYLNLVEPTWPSMESGVRSLDLILCRNVLIYLERAAVAEVARRLVAALAPGGWLLLGASDPGIADLAPVEVVLTGAGLAYRRASGEARARTVNPPVQPSVPPPPVEVEVALHAIQEPPLSPLPAVEPLPELPEPLPRAHVEPGHIPSDIQRAYAARDYAQAVSLAERDIQAGGGDPAVWVLLVRALANQGRLEEAGHACAAAVDGHRESAELLHLHALLLLQGGRAAEAVAAARRALYLDRSMVVAHLVHASALARLGDHRGAARAYANVLSLVERVSPDTEIPGADGETASRLARLARAQMRHHAESGR